MAAVRQTRVTAKQRQRVLDLHEQGLGRNEIARETKLGLATVTRIVHQAGGTFDRTATEQATRARQLDNRARRTELSSKLLDKVESLLVEMDGPFLAFNIGGKDNVYTEHELDKAPTLDKKNLMLAASTALQRHLDIERHDAEQGTADARAMLADLGRALGVRDPAG